MLGFLQGDHKKCLTRHKKAKHVPDIVWGIDKVEVSFRSIFILVRYLYTNTSRIDTNDNSRLKADSQEVKEYKEPSLLAGIEDAKLQGCF